MGCTLGSRICALTLLCLLVGMFKKHSYRSCLGKGARKQIYIYIYIMFLSNLLELKGIMLKKGKPFVITILTLNTLVVYLLHSSCHSSQNDGNLPYGFYESSNVKYSPLFYTLNISQCLLVPLWKIRTSHPCPDYSHNS